MTKSLGTKIKDLRKERSWTLKEFGEKCNLSAGYLSLVERDLAAINVASLGGIAKAFEIDISAFFTAPPAPVSRVIRGHEHIPFSVGKAENIYYHNLTGNIPSDKATLEPILVHMKPVKDPVWMEIAPRDGEAFCYVLEGLVLLVLDGKEYELYPGDSFHILSSVPHAVMNNTNRMAKILYINTVRFLPVQ